MISGKQMLNLNIVIIDRQITKSTQKSAEFTKNKDKKIRQEYSKKRTNFNELKNIETK